MSTFEPTAVPNEFATSFAPTANASRKANTKARAAIHAVCSNQVFFASSNCSEAAVRTATKAETTAILKPLLDAKLLLIKFLQLIFGP